MRKIILSIFLILALTVPFASAETTQPDATDKVSLLDILNQATEPDFLGMWYATEITMGGTTFPAGTLGIEITADFHEDGTVTLTALDDQTTGTWARDASGNITLDDGESVSTVEIRDDRLIMEAEGTTVIFDREQGAAADELGQISTEVTAADFVGAWVGTEAESEGVRLPLAALGFDMRMEVFADGTITLGSDALGEDIDGTWKLSAHVLLVTADGSTSVMTMHDGRLVLDDEMGTLIIFDRIP